MTVSKKNLRIIETLMRDDHIRAAVWVDHQGDVKARRGKAHSLRLSADEPTGRIPIDKQPPAESLYISQFNDDDFLIVIFDDDVNFEELKKSVDTTLQNGLDQ